MLAIGSTHRVRWRDYRTWRIRARTLFVLILLSQIISLLAILQQDAYAAADPVVKQGNFTKRTSTGSQAVTGLGFQPKAVVFYWTLQTTAGTSGATGQFWGQGFATGASNERALSVWDEDQTAIGTTDSGRATYNNASIVMQGDDGAAAGVADLTSLDSDGFTLNWSTANSSPYIIYYYAFSQDIVTDATVNSFSLTTGTGNLSVTNAGFQPDFVMMMTAGTTVHGSNAAELTYSMGVATSSSAQWATGGRADDAVDFSDTCSYQRTNAVIAYVGSAVNCATTTEDALADFTQFTSNGFDINKSNAPSGAFDVFYLALKGPQFKVGNLTKPTTAQAQAVTGVGFRPVGLSLMSWGQAASSSLTAESNFVLGTTSGIGVEGSIGAASNDNNDASSPGMRTATDKVVTAIEGNAETLTAETKFTRFDSDGFTIDWITADSIADQYLYWAIGVPLPAYTQSIYKWYSNADDEQPGSQLASENTATTIASTAKTTPVRLRTQLSVATNPLIGNTQDFKLQSSTSTGGPWTDINETWCNDSSGITCTTSWGARRKITIDNSAASQNLTDFPVLVVLNSSRIDYSKTQGAGQDIRFVDRSNPTVVLPHEIEKWDEAGTSYVWVKVPQLDAGSISDYIWMYYDNNGASDGQDAANVWDSNHRAVWHSDETSGTNLSDSTTNANTAAKNAPTDPSPNTGKINGSQDYNGSSGSALVNDSNPMDITGTITMSAWVKADTLGGAGVYHSILVKETSIGAANYSLQVVGGQAAVGWFSGGYIEYFSNTVLAPNTWYHIVGTFDVSTDEVKIYINGALDRSTTDTTTLTANAQGMTLGQSPAGEYWDGTIDEVRLSASIRSADWIRAEYLTGIDSMNSFGSEQGQSDVSVWKFYQNATPADGASIDSTLLTGSDVKGTYQESNPTALNPLRVIAGNQVEWDFALDPTSTANGTTYYFRMVKNDGTALGTYSVYPEITINAPPNSPTLLTQKTTGDVTISTGAWHNQDSVKFGASATDPNASDTLQVCVEKDPIGTSFSNTEDSCGTGVAYSGSTVTPNVTISSMADDDYHWQARVKDAAGEYSGWVSYGANTEGDMDFGIDDTPPVGGTVYDGLSIGNDLMFNNGTLTTLSANWTGFSDATSGLAWYDYAIGTTPGGTDLKGWSTAGDESVTSGSDSSLTLQTSQPYYVSIRALDEAGNVGSGVSSNGQYVLPTLSFGVSPSSVTFDNLNGTNSYADSKTTTLTTSTNAYGGYAVRAFTLGLLSGGGSTIANFPGSYAATAEWGSNTGFGYTTNDNDINGFPSSGSCSGSGVAPCYAAFSQTKPGDVVANHTANVTGTPISNEQFTITYRVATTNTQKATNYGGTIIYSVTPMY